MKRRASILSMLALSALLAVCFLMPQADAREAEPAAPADAGIYGEMLTEVFPDIVGKPAPSWLKEGLRVYYKTASGKLNKTESAAVKKLSEIKFQKPEDISVSPLLVRTDVTGIFSDKASTFSTMFLDVVILPWEDSSSLWPLGVGSFWMHPDLIKTTQKARPGITITDTTYRILSQEYQAVSISYEPVDQPDVYYLWIVEKSTGLLLYAAKAYRPKSGAEIELHAVEFYSMRYVSLPWSATSLPGFAKPGFTLTYEGNIQTWNKKTGPGLSVPALIKVKVSEVDEKLISAGISRIYSETESYENKIYIGTAQIEGSFWLPVGIIPKLREGQVIDKDPVTNTVLEVSYIGLAKDGTGRIGIFEFGKNYKRAWVFRTLDGLLMYWMEDKVIDPIYGVSQKAEWTLK